MITSVLMWLAGAVAVAAAAVRWHRARHDLTPGVRYLCAAVGTVGCSAALAAPLSVALLTPMEPFANFSRWLPNSLAIGAAWSVHALLLHLVDRPERARPAVRRQAVGLLLAVVAMTVLLIHAAVPSSPDFVAAAGHRWQITAYVVVFCGYVGYSLASFTRLMGRYQALTERPWLRRGLRLARLGAIIGIGWATVKIAAAGTVLAGNPGGWEGTASAVLSASCVALVGLGVTMPAWGPTAAAPARWIRRARSYLALRPLWTELSATFPEVTRQVPTRQTSITWRLTRRVIEIEDALLLLTRYRPDRGDSVARGPLREAADIREALSAAALGNAQQQPAPSPPPGSRTPSDLDVEAERLSRIARAYRRLPTTGDPRREDFP